MRSLNDVLTKMIYEEGSEHIPTGFKELDRILGGGLSPEDVTLVAGRPFMGKTSFLLDIAIHHAKTTGKKVAFFSFEDSEESVALSILGKASKNAKEYREIFSSQDLKRKIEEDGQDVVSAYADVNNLPILIYWNPTISPFEIKEICEAINQLGMIVIDSSRRFDIGQVTTQYLAELSQVALSLHLPVICSCNVNRSVEFHENHRPSFESIIGSGLRVGTPEPTIIAVYREDYYSHEKWGGALKRPAEAIVIPYGRTCIEGKTANLIWNEQRARFENIEENDKTKEWDDTRSRFENIKVSEIEGINIGAIYNGECDTDGVSRWVILTDSRVKKSDTAQSKERQYDGLQYRVCDTFKDATELFINQMMTFDYDGVIGQINAEIAEMRLCEYEKAEEEVLASQVCAINIDIDEGAYKMSGEAGRVCVPNGWDVFYFRYFNSDYRFQVSENCFKMENPKDKYFFEITHFNSSTGEYDPHFYMELSPSL